MAELAAETDAERLRTRGDALLAKAILAKR